MLRNSYAALLPSIRMSLLFASLYGCALFLPVSILFGWGMTVCLLAFESLSEYPPLSVLRYYGDTQGLKIAQGVSGTVKDKGSVRRTVPFMAQAVKQVQSRCTYYVVVHARSLSVFAEHCTCSRTRA